LVTLIENYLIKLKKIKFDYFSECTSTGRYICWIETLGLYEKLSIIVRHAIYGNLRLYDAELVVGDPLLNTVDELASTHAFFWCDSELVKKNILLYPLSKYLFDRNSQSPVLKYVLYPIQVLLAGAYIQNLNKICQSKKN
jgi:hypothetical protein